MARRTFYVIIMAWLWMGCACAPAVQTPPRVLSEDQIQQLRAEVQSVGDECRGQRLSGRLPGFVTSVKCSNPRILAVYQNADFPYMSLVNLALAKRLQLAERADAKKISEGDMQVEFFTDFRNLPAMSAP